MKLYIFKLIIVFILINFKSYSQFDKKLNDKIKKELILSHDVLKNRINNCTTPLEIDIYNVLSDLEIEMTLDFFDDFDFNKIINSKNTLLDFYLITIYSSGESFEVNQYLIIRSSNDEFWIFENGKYHNLIKCKEQKYFVLDYLENLNTSINKRTSITTSNYLFVEKLTFKVESTNENILSIETFLNYDLKLFNKYIIENLLLNKLNYWN